MYIRLFYWSFLDNEEDEIENFTNRRDETRGDNSRVSQQPREIVKYNFQKKNKTQFCLEACVLGKGSKK